MYIYHYYKQLLLNVLILSADGQKHANTDD